MPDDWIRGIKFFYNTTVPFDNLEPYSTYACLPIGTTTFILATYVYVTLLRYLLEGYAIYIQCVTSATRTSMEKPTFTSSSRKDLS